MLDRVYGTFDLEVYVQSDGEVGEPSWLRKSSSSSSSSSLTLPGFADPSSTNDNYQEMPNEGVGYDYR